jgi:hypothetical protein
VEKETAIPRTANIILSASGPVRGACDPPRPQIVEQLLVPLAPDFRRETKAATKPDSYPAVGERPALSPGDETPHGESANFHLLQPVQVIISGRFWVIAEGFAQTQVYPSGIPQGSATSTATSQGISVSTTAAACSCSARSPTCGNVRQRACDGGGHH